MDAFILIGQIGFARARKCFYDLGRWDKDVWFHDNHACLGYLGLFAIVVVIVIHSQVKLVLFAKRPDNPYNVTLLYPKLERPPPNESHPEEDWAFNESDGYRRTVLVHWRTQLEFKHSVIVWGTLIKLDFKQTIDKTLVLKIVFFVVQIRLSGSCLDHRFEESWRHFLKPLFF